jgi:hypothetical protein
MAVQPIPAPARRREALLLLASLLGILGLLGRAIFMIVTGLDAASGAGGDSAGGVLDALGMLACAGMLAPTFVHSLRRLRGGEIRPARVPPARFWPLAALAAIWVGSVAAGSVLSASVLSEEPGFAWIAVAPFFLAGVSLPIAGLSWIAAGGQPAGSARRLWAAFGLSMAGSTLLALVAEYAVLGAAALVFIAAAAANPDWLTLAQQLRDQLSGAAGMEAVLNVLAPYLTNPLALLAVLAFAAGIGPLIEEAVKPAAVWLLGRRLRSPAEGFALGALCGAGFSMLEGMAAASGATEMLGFGLIGRAASSLMHITASALVGWGIASARLGRRPWRLAGAYLLGVGIHSLWNGSAVLAVFGALRFMLAGAGPDLLGGLAMLVGLATLGLLLAVMLVLLPLISARLRSASRGPGQAGPAQAAAAGDDIIAPPIP